MNVQHCPAHGDRSPATCAPTDCTANGCVDEVAAVLPLGERLTPAAALRRLHREATVGVVDTGRYRCPYYSWGDGPPLTFIHGLSDLARSFAMVCGHLSKRYRCIAFDLPTGHGDGAVLRRYRHKDLVADLFALLDHLNIKQSYVLGSSFGSTIALAALRGQPGRLPRGILQGGFARRPLAPTELFIARLLRSIHLPMARLPVRDLTTRLADYSTFAAQPAAFWTYFCKCSGHNPVAAVARRALLLHEVDERAVLPSIQQPVLLVCGEFDALVGRDCEETLLEGLPNARRVVIEGCGHYAQYTHAETMAALIDRFLTPTPKVS